MEEKLNSKKCAAYLGSIYLDPNSGGVLLNPKMEEILPEFDAGLVDMA